MWNNAAFSSSSSSSPRIINTDYNLSSLVQGGVGGESSNLRSPNEYEKIPLRSVHSFLNEWFTSPYSKDETVPVLHSEMEFSSSNLPLSPIPLTCNDTSVGEREGMMKSVGLNSEETQIITSQAVSGNEDGNLRIAKRLKPTCTEKQAHKSPLEASEKRPKVKRSQKLGHKITALQQLVCPFGKTDTASVLSETASCIKYLHDQIKILTAPYMVIPCYQQALIDNRNELHKRGLCLVPISPAIVNLAAQLSFDKNLPTKIAPRSKFEF